MGLLGIVPLRYWAYLAVFAVVAGAGWTAYYRIDAAGYGRCRAEWTQAVGEAKEKRDAELFVARLRGDALSKALAEKERQLSDLKGEYLTYANSIVGNCPADLGLLVQSASAAAGVPAPSSPSPDPAATIAAAAIGANIATNYPRCHAAIAQLNALIDWHAAAEEAVK